jgi:hypothetical protein
MSNLNQKLGAKLYGNSHKLVLKYIISTIKTQVDGDAETPLSIRIFNWFFKHKKVKSFVCSCVFLYFVFFQWKS